MTIKVKNNKLERIILESLRPLIRELRLVDVSDYVAYLRFDKHHQVADIFDSAVEQFFAPDFLHYRELGHADLDWGKEPIISLELALNTPTAVFEFTLQLKKTHTSIELGRINRHATVLTDALDDEILERAITINKVG